MNSTEQPIHEHQAKMKAHIANSFAPSTILETDFVKSDDLVSMMQKGEVLNVFSERAVQQIETDLNKAEDTGFWKGEKVDKDSIEKTKGDVAKLQKKVVTDKNGGTKTVYIQVKNETKPHHKMTHEELMEHHDSKELHEIAENYRKSHEDVKTSVDKNGAADDSFKSQKAEHKRGDVAASEEYYMHIKQAAYKKEKVEGKAAESATKSVNKPVKIEDKKDDVKKAQNYDISKAFETLGIDTIAG